MGKKAVVTLSFQVTLQQPEGTTIKETREAIVNVLSRETLLGVSGSGVLKVHLINKETSYGKR